VIAYSKHEKGPWVVILPTTKVFKEPVKGYMPHE